MAMKTPRAGKDAIETVMGHRIPPPRLTRAAWFAAVKYLGLPFLGLMLALDLLLYLVFRYGFESCYGLFCLLG